MSETKNNALDAMLAQYESNNKPKFEKSEVKVYDLKNYFTTFIKDGVKSATKQIRILPTPDGSTPFVEMYGHKIKLEGTWKTFACLKKEKGEACPFCEAREALLAEGKESDKELAKKYNAKLMYVVKVIDREHEEEGVKFWRFNHDYRKEGVLDKITSVLLAIKKDVTNPTTGRDLSITINRKEDNSLVVSGIASLDPTPLSEDTEKVTTWLADVRTWEDVYSVRTYDYLEIIVKGGIPVWDKVEKKFVDKASLKTDEVKELDAELVVGAEAVKTNVTAATNTTTPESEVDDLPF